jgi:transcriptional regulator with XRE-family HTH domain
MSKAERPRYLSGTALRNARVAAGLEQSELALRVGATQGQISGWEREHTGCRLGMLHKLAAALDVKPDELTLKDCEQDAAVAKGAAA